MKQFECFGTPVTVAVGMYGDGLLALQLYDNSEERKGEPYAIVTVNRGLPVGEYQAYIKNYSENEGMAGWLVDNGFGQLVVEHGQPVGGDDMPLMRFDGEFLRDIDPTGTEAYEHKNAISTGKSEQNACNDAEDQSPINRKDGQTNEIKIISAQELAGLANTEGLILQGCGGDPLEWVDGINQILAEEGILMSGSSFKDVYSFDHGGLTNLLFNMDGVSLDIGKLAMWRLKTHGSFGGTWLSDYLPNRLGIESPCSENPIEKESVVARLRGEKPSPQKQTPKKPHKSEPER